MSTKNAPRAQSFLAQMKARAQSQGSGGSVSEPTTAKMRLNACPNCGAGRAKEDGLTLCAYCGFEYLSVRLSDGLHLTADDNSRR
jgi:uncharacterized protein (DUF983 family)